ncbi:hypothetical protein GC175_30400 [bacterium]|nr:hypothetical protein [bacterium]
MIAPAHLLSRLEEIGRSLSKKRSARALIGLGSVGVDMDRLDEYSDLDFFVVVEPGSKADYLTDLAWLTDVAEVTYAFQNTRDGHKLLYEDGVFCEFAVFDENELENAVFSPGRIVWKAEGVDSEIRMPRQAINEKAVPALDWLLGEILTNLYMGLLRHQRGEKLSAMRFIQGHAVDRVLELAEQIYTAASGGQDAFSIERRYEQRYPQMIKILPDLMQGYAKNVESARSILRFVDKHTVLDPNMRRKVLALCDNEQA